MRIRKNAKNSTLFYTNTNVSNDGDECLLHKNLCQLNQSPWDIITFPSADSSSSLYQFDDYEAFCDVNHDGYGSTIDSVRDLERKITVDDIVTLVKTFKGKNDNLADPKNDQKEILGFEEGKMNENREEMLLCDVRDKKGWQCGRMVKNGETMCDHHLIEMQNHAVWTTKKKSKPVTRTRAWQTKKQATPGPYEFYYYSGFGPSWGKKRGMGDNFSNAYNEHVKVVSDDNKIAETGLPDDVTCIQKEEEKGFELETSEVQPEKMKLTFIDGDDNKKVKVGKKRGRKPMKARSLKSLM
ncbi:hypothetical protein R6Q59_032295 [Mikania micrantha]|uniref:WRC domain-containing protein n=1 Tax=Mikania micrantha TaxID=192012 RepID=A0A5N6NS19_9ASTR|nr:hypothetical protein E3N88_16976 [Mikania micrantha]